MEQVHKQQSMSTSRIILRRSFAAISKDNLKLPRPLLLMDSLDASELGISITPGNNNELFFLYCTVHQISKQR